MPRRNDARFVRLPRFQAAILLLITAGMVFAQPAPSPPKAYRVVATDRYELSVQKSGRVNVYFANHQPVFEEACPLVQFADEEDPVPLDINGRYTERVEVRNALGEGQGLLFSTKECAWRVNSYPTQSFFTVQVVFTNRGSKPVRVQKLIPWSVGVSRRGALRVGPDAQRAPILENGRVFQTFNDSAKVVTGKSGSQWNVALFNPRDGRSLIAGFLTNVHGYTQFRLDRSEKAKDDEFDYFTAECVYDPPIEVPPDGSINSEILYVAIAEQSPHEGLERFSAASAAMNGIRVDPPFLPHGWDPSCTLFKQGISEEGLIQDLDALDRKLKRYGWTHFAVGAGWERSRGDWEPNDRFPQGMKWLSEEIHRRGMTAGLWIEPFTASEESPVSREHPEWLLELSPPGQNVLPGAHGVLDSTAPGVCEHVRDICRKVSVDWGFDAITDADSASHILLATRYHDPGVTNVEALRLGMQAMREGLGTDKFLMTGTPQPVNAMFADGIRMGRDCAPIWRAKDLNGPSGAVEALTNAIHRYYVMPNLYIPDPGCVFFPDAATSKRWNVEDYPELTMQQSIAWLTGAALTAGVVKVGKRFSELTDAELHVLQRLLPVPGRPARPIDLFQTESPRIWALPVDCAIGRWLVLGLFNWDASAPQTVPLDFAAVGLKPGTPYTVFSFWDGKYYGVAQDHLNVQLAPASMKLLGLRPYEGRPMLLATDRHFTMGATDFTSLSWDDAACTLTGTFDAVEDTDYVLYLYLPASYRAGDVVLSRGSAEIHSEERVLRVAFHCDTAGPLTWRASFEMWQPADTPQPIGGTP